MSNKPIKTLSISPKRADGSYIKLGNNATWGDDKWRYSINVEGLRELLVLIDSGAIEVKKGYIGGSCSVFNNSEPIPQIATKQETQTMTREEKQAVFNSDEIPF